MEKREKIAWGLAILSWMVVGSYYYAEKGNAEVRERELFELRTEKEKLSDDIEDLKAENDSLALAVGDLNDSLADADSVIADLRARPEPRPVEVVRWRTLTADCLTCMENNELPVSVVDDNRWVMTHVRDAFHPEDGASVSFLPAFDRDILAPARRQIKKCEGLLDDCNKLLDEATSPGRDKPESPLSFDSEHGVFLGAGYIGDDNLGLGLNYSGRFVRFGSPDGLNANLGINAGGFSPFDGRDIEIFGLAGGEIKW